MEPTATAGLLPATGRKAPRERACTLALVVASMLPAGLLLGFPSLAFVLPGPDYVVLHAVVEMAVVAISFATFAVQWYAAGAGAGEARGRLLGAAFLGVAVLETCHLLAFPGMSGFVTAASTGRGIWYWFAARLWTVGALLAATFVPPGHGHRLLRRRFLLAASLAACAAVVMVELRTPGAAALFYAEGTGLTSLKKGIESLVMGAAAVTGLLYLQEYRSRGERTSLSVAAALGLTVLSELCFAAYGSPYDAFNLFGHLYLAAAFSLIFHALFVGTLLRPYRDLQATTAELSASNAELTRLRRLIEGELAVTIARLREAQELRDDLMRAVTHDLRTPLQVIMLQADRLRALATGGSPEKLARSAETILEGVRRITAMLKDLDDSVKLESGNSSPALQPVRLPELVNGLIASASAVLDAGRIQCGLPADLPPVQADPRHLERVFTNLLTNALKYSAPGSPVRVAAATAPGEVRISIADRGPGIAAVDLPRIFDRFYRGRRSSGEGLGLGLYIVRRMVEAHGGRVSADSREGEGSTFTVVLPVAGRGEA